MDRQQRQRSSVAYEVEVTGNVAHGCDCLAGLNGDPVCKHRAAFFLLIGALDLDPEPDPPAPASRSSASAAGAGRRLPGLCRRRHRRPHRAGRRPRRGRPGGRGRGPAWSRRTRARQPEYVGRAGHVAGYDVFLAGDTMLVTHAASGPGVAARRPELRHGAGGAGAAAGAAARVGALPRRCRGDLLLRRRGRQLRLRLNLSDPALSEWGYAPFASADGAPATSAAVRSTTMPRTATRCNAVRRVRGAGLAGGGGCPRRGDHGGSRVRRLGPGADRLLNHPTRAAAPGRESGALLCLPDRFAHHRPA